MLALWCRRRASETDLKHAQGRTQEVEGDGLWAMALAFIRIEVSRHLPACFLVITLILYFVIFDLQEDKAELRWTRNADILPPRSLFGEVDAGRGSPSALSAPSFRSSACCPAATPARPAQISPRVASPPNGESAVSYRWTGWIWELAG